MSATIANRTVLMAEAITALVGAVIMIGYVLLIAARLATAPLLICTAIGVALMLWGFWGDAWRPILARLKS
jgi:hypothetical protein